MILLLNGALSPGFVAVRRDARSPWAWRSLELGRGAAFIGAVVEELMEGASLKTLTDLVVIRGPGSSTGLRIVGSYANALALVSGADNSVLSSFDLASALLPHTPSEIVFPQPHGRWILATESEAGEWSAGDVSAPPPGIAHWDTEAQAAAEAKLNAELFDALIAEARPAEVVTPLYWAPPMVTSPKP